MIGDIKDLIDLFSQLNPLQSWLLLGVIFGVTALFYKWGMPALEKWRARKNLREAKDKQIQANMDKSLELERKYSVLEQKITALESKHDHDIKLAESEAVKRKQQSLDIQKTLHQEILEYREESRNAMNVILEAVNKIREEATEREISNMRYKIIRFAKELRCGDPKSQDEYNHIFQTVDDYHAVLDKLERENGQIDIEVAFIQKQYMHHMETNDFVV